MLKCLLFFSVVEIKRKTFVKSVSGYSRFSVVDKIMTGNSEQNTGGSKPHTGAALQLTVSVYYLMGPFINAALQVLLGAPEAV